MLGGGAVWTTFLTKMMLKIVVDVLQRGTTAQYRTMSFKMYDIEND